MIGANEMLCGTQFYINGKISRIEAQDIEYVEKAERYGHQQEAVRAILITPEMLTRAGFEKVVEKIGEDLFRIGNVYVAYKKNGTQIYLMEKGMGIGKPMVYMHQLQGVCRMMFGVEVVIK